MSVKVEAKQAAGGIKWTIDGKDPRTLIHSFGRKTGPHELQFDLDDRTGTGLRFDKDPIWVHETEEQQCPPKGIGTDQIQVSSVEPRKLTIQNRNDGAPRTMHYQLNFVDGSGARRQIDPIIKNGGST